MGARSWRWELKFVQWFKWNPFCEWRARIFELLPTHNYYFVYINQPCRVATYIFTNQLFVVVYKVQATQYYLEGCSPSTIGIPMSFTILFWGSFSYDHWDSQQTLCMWWEYAFLTIDVIVLWKPWVVLWRSVTRFREYDFASQIYRLQGFV